MDRHKPPAQPSPNGKSARKSAQNYLPKQRQGKNNNPQYNSPNNHRNDAHNKQWTRDKRLIDPFKSCILDDDTPTGSSSRAHFKPSGNKSKTSSQKEPPIGKVNGAKQSDSKGLEILSYDTMIASHTISDTIIPFMSQFKLDDAQIYSPLTSECFVKEIGDYYYCALCCLRERINSRNLDAHTTNEKHVDQFLSLRSKLLNLMPRDESVNMVALKHLTDTWLKRNTLDDIQTEGRIAAISDLGAALAEVDPVCSCRIIGSFYNGTSLSSSDVNLELMHPNSKLFQADPRARDSIHHKLADPDAVYGSQLNHHTLHYDLISNPADTLYRLALFLYKGYSTVKTLTLQSTIDDLNRKTPTLILLHEPTQVTLEVACYAEASHKLACLLKNYISLDRRALELSILVKYWAKICKISNPKQGTLSPETFVILVIHFLQRVQPPVLPCLHERLSEENEKQRKDEQSLAEALESVDLADNPGCDDVAAPKDSPERDIDYEDEATDHEFDADLIETIDWRSKNTSETHQLFIEFLQFSMREFACLKSVISIRTLKKVKPADKEWSTEIKAIEHPIKPRVNMGKNIGTFRTFEYVRQCFAHGYYYLTSVPMVSGLRRHTLPLQHPTDYIKLFINLEKFDFYFKMKEAVIKNGAKKSLVDEMIKQDLFDRDVAVIKELIEYFVVNNRNLDSLPITVSKNYDLQMLIPEDSNAAIFCWLCRSIGHQRTTCPRKRVLTLQEQDFDQSIDSAVDFDHQFLQLYVEDMITTDLANEHAEVVRELTESIRLWTNLQCELKLFGSTVNLLGCFDSDLDICMTLADNPTGRGVDYVEVLKSTLECLKQNTNVPPDSIEPVLSARVPIIKFKYKKFDVDLSMYNQCAVHNSILLRTYVLLDYRVAQLFYLVKRYAKACFIADASRGSLSSYAWSLLVIHFLQHSEPPILPVLQETSDSQPKPTFGVNGWNVWFDANMENKSMPENKSTLTSLFKQFLFYYANFDFNQYVVSIRTSRLLTKFQKNWTNCMIAIEDPFELTYNLSGRLDDPMALYIRNSFAKTYTYVYKFQQDVRRRVQVPSLGVIKFLFRGQAIMGSEPPFRGCRICHRIGHKVKECPETLRRNNARQQQIRDKRQETESEPAPDIVRV